jgi:hypothetical protein
LGPAARDTPLPRNRAGCTVVERTSNAVSIFGVHQSCAAGGVQPTLHSCYTQQYACIRISYGQGHVGHMVLYLGRSLSVKRRLNFFWEHRNTSCTLMKCSPVASFVYSFTDGFSEDRRCTPSGSAICVHGGRGVLPALTPGVLGREAFASHHTTETPRPTTGCLGPPIMPSAHSC